MSQELISVVGLFSKTPLDDISRFAAHITDRHSVYCVAIDGALALLTEKRKRGKEENDVARPRVCTGNELLTATLELYQVDVSQLPNLIDRQRSDLTLRTYM